MLFTVTRIGRYFVIGGAKLIKQPFEISVGNAVGRAILHAAFDCSARLVVVCMNFGGQSEQCTLFLSAHPFYLVNIIPLSSHTHLTGIAQSV
jgi:hypothetical protein